MHHTRGREVRRPNPLTDELSDETKAELAAAFAEMRRRYASRHRVGQRDTYTERLTGRRGW